MKTVNLLTLALLLAAAGMTARAAEVEPLEMQRAMRRAGLCLLYTSDAADE